ncbi:MAG: efflux RND transporter permease subunit [Deltaproteobacteria bacterium]|nr:efflux RND transporter permease subunit [Deltaproteobacteria bacterium]
MRFRPIMMTTMAPLVGILPIAIGSGAGAETRRGPGVAVVGGLLVSQVLPPDVTPVIHLWIDALSRRLRRGTGSPSATPPDGWAPARTAAARTVVRIGGRWGGRCAWPMVRKASRRSWTWTGRFCRSTAAGSG